MKPTSHWLATIGIALVTVVTAGNTWLALHNVEALHEATRQVMHSQLIMESLDRLLSTAQDAETGERGFIITGDPDYLTPYHLAQGELRERWNTVDSLTTQDRHQQQLLAGVRHNLDARMEVLAEAIELRQNEGFQAVTRTLTNAHGKAEMDSLRDRIGAMLDYEDGVLRTRRTAATVSRDRTDTGLVLAGLLELATLAAIVWLMRRNLRRRERDAMALFEQREQLRVTLGSIGDAVITTDTVGRVTSLNAVAETLTGWTSGAATGRPLDEIFCIVNESTRQPVSNPAVRALTEGAIVGLANHTVLVARDGTERPIDDSAAPIRDSEGRVIGAVLVFRDITDRYRAERQLREADQRKDDFLAVLAHELRNPLAPLRNALGVMQLSPGDPSVVERVGGIMERQLHQMVHLIDDLLDVSRITHNRLELRREPVDIATVIHSALETCGPALRESRHALKLTLPPHPVWIDADRTRMAQAIGNLLHNAIKYTEPGGRIWLTAAREGSDAVVTVRDSGIGIAPDMFGTIFEMFAQVDRSLERTRGGLGLGLPLVKHIIEMHGGSIHVDSEGPGKGTEFSIRLPVILSPTAPEHHRSHVTTATRARRILVADDNSDNADSLAMMLRVMGHDVCVARDGEEAFAEAERFRPEVALLDIGMPKLNGYDLAKRIRSTPWGRDVMLVALTGWGQDEDRLRSREAGFNHHMVKPVELDGLRQVLDEVRTA